MSKQTQAAPVAAPVAETTVVNPVPVAEQPTLAEKLAAAIIKRDELKTKLIAVLNDPTKTDLEQGIIMRDANTARAEVSKLEVLLERELAASKAQREIDERVALVDQLIANPSDTELADKLRGLLRNGLKTQLHIPAGMSGAKLASANGSSEPKTGTKLDFYVGLIDSGMTREQIMAAHPESVDAKGGANGTLRTAFGVVSKRAKSAV